MSDKIREDCQMRREVEMAYAGLTSQLRQLRAEMARRDDRHDERSEIGAYIQRRAAEVQDEVAPELLDYIGGNSIEEVERSITAAREKTASILEGVRLAQAQFSPPARANSQQPPQPSAEDISQMAVGSREHLALRAAFGLDRACGRGLLD